MDTPLVSRPPAATKQYFELAESDLKPTAEHEPVCLYLETTNRCNLLCQTCPRTFEDLESPADMSWGLFTSIVDQFPRIARVVLHGVGEPMMVRELPRMVRYLKGRGTYVLFNTNGTLLNRRKGRQLIDAGLDELRVSLDAAEGPAFKMVRGLDLFDRIVANLRSFIAMQHELKVTAPRVSLWLTGLKEPMDQLPAFVRLAHQLGVREVYLQRLVFFPEGIGLARAPSTLFDQLDSRDESLLREAQSLSASLGVTFNASGATDPGASIRKGDSRNPWSLCRRPWTLMYFTAHGHALPCCIAPFSMRGYDSFTLGDATQQTLREIWNGPRYQEFRRALLSDHPHAACSNCGVRWSL